LCRVTRSDAPLGAFTENTYCTVPSGAPNCMGNPNVCGCANGQRTHVETPGPNGGRLFSESYVDGLSRSYKTISGGVGMAKPIVTETTFDERGNVSQTSLPYYMGDSVYWTTTHHDAQNRVSSITPPLDGAHPQFSQPTTLSYAIVASGSEFSRVRTTDEAG